MKPYQFNPLEIYNGQEVRMSSGPIQSAFDFVISWVSGVLTMLTYAGAAGVARALRIGAGAQSGTNIAGNNTTIQGGQGTGTGAGGAIDLQTAPAGSTGAAVNALRSVLKLLGNGSLEILRTITASGTTAPQTIDKPAGAVNFAASDASKVVNNALVTANSLIIAVVQTNDATMKSVAAVPGAGSFTLYADAAPTAETRVAFLVLN